MPSKEKVVASQPKLKEIKVRGYSFSFNPDVIDDVEVLEELEALSNNNPAVMITFLRRVLGDSGWQAMKAYFVKKEGKMRITTLEKVFTGIFENFDPKESL